jgi:hypothetical protein
LDLQRAVFDQGFEEKLLVEDPLETDKKLGPVSF